MRAQWEAASRSLSACVFALLLALRWMHAQFVRPLGALISEDILPVAEEVSKAFVREWFAVLSRNINAASAFVLALFSGRSYRRTAARHAAEKQAAWHRWWQSARGTFNALVEQEGLTANGSSTGSTKGIGQGTSRQPRQHEEIGGSSVGSTNGRPAALRVLRPPHASQSSVSGLGKRTSQGSPWSFWRRRRSGSDGALDDSCPPTPSDLRRGSLLFELPSGFAVSQMMSGRGLLEDLRVGTEVAVGRVFLMVRTALRRVLWLDSGGPNGGMSRTGSDTDSPADLLARRMRRSTAPPMPAVAEEGLAAAGAMHDASEAAAASGAAEGPPRRRVRRPTLKSLLRSGRHWEEDLSVWTASDVILREGYPLEQHSVTTADGYVLQMHRIPRHGARDVVFFQHGVLDTSLGWVSNGVVGSAAFAAFDAGFDVWLANSRANAPRLHIDPKKQGSRYWRFSMNEMALGDTTAEIAHIHNTKMAELATPGRHAAATLEHQQQMRRASTDSMLGTRRWVDVHAQHTQGSARGDVEQGTAERSTQNSQGARPHSHSQPPQDAEDDDDDQQQQQQEQQREQQAEQQQDTVGIEATRSDSWRNQLWQRLIGRSAAAGERPDLALGAGTATGTASAMRRSQSATEPLQQAGGHKLAVQDAVPTRLTGGQQRQQQHEDHKDDPSRQGEPSSREGGTAGAAGAAGQDVLPYRLQAVGHSLGAATLLMYAVGSRMRGQPHRLRRLILMSPAGFHPTIPLALRFCKWLFPAIVWLVDRTPGLKGRGMGLRLPSPLLRYITFKFTKDLRHMPALQDLVRAGMQMMLSGDSSQWTAAVQMPHYSTYSMPALSLHSGAHFAQWSNDLSFRLFDYGTAAANWEHYGSDRPPSIAEHYHLLDVPVDLLAGAADGIIPPACVIMHMRCLRGAGVPCSFRILPLGHMDFTLAVKEDIRHFVLAKLRHAL